MRKILILLLFPFISNGQGFTYLISGSNSFNINSSVYPLNSIVLNIRPDSINVELDLAAIPSTLPPYTYSAVIVNAKNKNKYVLDGVSCSTLVQLRTWYNTNCVGGGGGSPTGSAGGDLSGTYPSPSIKSNVSLSGSPTTTTQSSGDNSTKIASTSFVRTEISNAIAAVNPAVAVQAATISNISGYTYSNGVSGIGATLTQNSASIVTIDGYMLLLGDRVLFKNQTSALTNGVYFVSTLGTGLIPAVFTRTLDYDQSSDMNNTGAIPVVNGTVNTVTSWLQSSTVNNVGTDAVTYVKFTNSPNQTLAGSWAITPDGVTYIFTTTVSSGYTYAIGGLINIYNPSSNGVIQCSLNITGTTLTAIIWINDNLGVGIAPVLGTWGTPSLPTINYILSR